jgi:hypothetical protein
VTVCCSMFVLVRVRRAGCAAWEGVASCRGSSCCCGTADDRAPDLQDSWMTSLHIASKWGHPAVVQALLEAGADIEEQDVEACFRNITGFHSLVLTESLGPMQCYDCEPTGIARSRHMPCVFTVCLSPCDCGVSSGYFSEHCGIHLPPQTRTRHRRAHRPHVPTLMR